MKHESLILREVVDDDLPHFFEHQRDPVANRLAGSSPRDLETYTEHWSQVASNETVLRRTIEVEGAPVGYVASFLRTEQREIGYWIARSLWGQGITTRALTAFLVLERTRPLEARTAKQNLASLRVLEKCGFVRKGEDVFTNRAGESFEEHVLVLEAASFGRSGD